MFQLYLNLVLGLPLAGVLQIVALALLFFTVFLDILGQILHLVTLFHLGRVFGYNLPVQLADGLRSHCY